MFEDYTFLDVTYPLNDQVPTWNGSCGFKSAIHLDYEDGCKVMSYKLHGGIGTHMDAPLHFYKEGLSIGEMPVSSFFVPIRKIDVRHKRDPDLLISLEDIEEHERCFGKIPPKHFVIGYTGWGEFWHDKTLYRQEDSCGRMHFPGFAKEVAHVLLDRKIVGLGIDTLSPDTGEDGFPVHELLLKQGCYILENMAYLENVPCSGAFLVVLPLRIESGVESPVRAIVLFPKKN